MADTTSPLEPTVLIIMGVSGAGKTTLATHLAERLSWPYLEGDALHPRGNVDKMRAGVPLDDADRWPWLAAIGGQIDSWRRAGSPGILTCSSLRQCYRQQLAADRPAVRFVYLRGEAGLLRERLERRKGHYMPASLLDSQLRTLEEPGDDEPVIALDAGATVDRWWAIIRDALNAAPLRA